MFRDDNDVGNDHEKSGEGTAAARSSGARSAPGAEWAVDAELAELWPTSSMEVLRARLRSWMNRAPYLIVGSLVGLDAYFCLCIYLKNFYGVDEDLRLIRLHSEQSFYYSYYKDFVDAPDLQAGLRMFLHDDRSESPSVINALRRFNIFPELVLGALMRQLRGVTGKLLDPFDFYALVIFGLHAMKTFTIMLISSAMLGGDASGPLKNNVYASVVTGLWLLGNFSNVDRVGMISLRENFALPFLFLQVFHVVSILRRAAEGNRDSGGSGDSEVAVRVSWREAIRLLISTVGFMVPWQLASFIILTQVVALMCVELLSALSLARLVAFRRALDAHRSIIRVLIAAFLITACAQMGNRLLLMSPGLHLALAYEIGCRESVMFWLSKVDDAVFRALAAGLSWIRFFGRQIMGLPTLHVPPLSKVGGESGTTESKIQPPSDQAGASGEGSDARTSPSTGGNPSPRAHTARRASRGTEMELKELYGVSDRLQIRLIRILLIFVCIHHLLTFLVKTRDDSHIWGLLLGIFWRINNNELPIRGWIPTWIADWITDYVNNIVFTFETKIYMKESVFMPTPRKVWRELIGTGAGTVLLPMLTLLGILSLELAVALRGIGSTLGLSQRRRHPTNVDLEARDRPQSNLVLLEPDILYFFVQGLVFTLLGVLIRRLMVFTVPFLAILMAGSPLILSAFVTRIFQLAPSPYRSNDVNGNGPNAEGKRVLEKKASPPKASTSAKKRHSHSNSGGSGSGAGHAEERPLARQLSFSIVDFTAPRARSFFNGESSPGLVMQNILYVSFAVSVLLMSQKNVARSLFQRRQQEISGVEKDTLSMIGWIRKHARPMDYEGRITIASDMTVTSHIRALVPSAHITNHPHFEDASARERTRKVYRFFGCAENKDILSALQELGTNYLIINHSPAFRANPLQCWLLRSGIYERPGHSSPDVCADETILSMEQFPVRSMWPINEGFTMQYHDYTYTILHVREPGNGPVKLVYPGPSSAYFGDETRAEAAGESTRGDGASCGVAGDSLCDAREEPMLGSGNPNEEPVILTHSGFYRYLDACMFTDASCIDHVLHLCDMWESQLSSKPIYTGYTKYSIDYERDLLRVTQLYATAINYFDTTARDTFDRVVLHIDGMNYTDEELLSLETNSLMEFRNGFYAIRQLPILVFECAEFLSYGRTQYDFAERYYLRAIDMSPNNVQYVLGYAKFLYYCLMSVEEANAHFMKASELIDNGTAITNNKLTASVHSAAVRDQSVFAEVYCEHGTFLLKTIDRRLMDQDLRDDKRVSLAAVLYNKAYDLDKYANCLLEMYQLISRYRQG